MDFPSSPLDDATALTWFAYADWLDERGAHPHEWTRAMRFAVGRGGERGTDGGGDPGGQTPVGGRAAGGVPGEGVVAMAEACCHCGERPGDGCIYCAECIDEMATRHCDAVKEVRKDAEREEGVSHG